MDRATKESVVANLTDIFKTAQVGYLVDFRGLSVEEATELRRKLRDGAAQMRVLKNNLARIAVRGTPFESLADDITETRALIFGQEPVQPAKVVSAYQKAHDKFKLIAGLLVHRGGGQKLDPRGVASLATLPSREELLARLLAVLQGPQAKLVRTLAEIPASFVRVLSAAAKARGEA